MIQDAARLPISDEYVRLSSPDRIVEDDRFVFPALALPVRSKGDFEMPIKHYQKLQEVLVTADRALVIGWAGADQHFLDLWRDVGQKPRMTLVVSESTDAAGNTATGLASIGIDRNVYPSGAKFSGLLTTHTNELQQFLNYRLPIG